MKTHTLGAGKFVDLILTGERNETVSFSRSLIMPALFGGIRTMPYSWTIYNSRKLKIYHAQLSNIVIAS